MFLPAMPFAVISGIGNWVSFYSFLYIVLIVGALLIAGVAMLAFSFYEDYYSCDDDLEISRLLERIFFCQALFPFG